MGMVDGVKTLIKYTRNPIEIVVDYRRGKQKIRVKCWNGTEFTLDHRPLYVSYTGLLCHLIENNVIEVGDGKVFVAKTNIEIDLNSTSLHRIHHAKKYIQNGQIKILNRDLISFKFNNINLKLKTLDGLNGLGQVVEVFFDKIYDEFNFKGKKVLDIGGFIGDSSIFFSISGAKKVVTVEPIAHELIRENLALNSITNVEVLPYAFSNKSKIVEIKMVGDAVVGASMYRENGDKVISVQSITPGGIFQKYGEFDIVKMDCECCEYETLKQVLEFVREGIVVEFHHPTKTLRKKKERLLEELKSVSASTLIDDKDASLIKIEKG